MDMNHVHAFTRTVVPPTCQQSGYSLYRCACGYEYRSEYTPQGAHAYVLTEQTAPTCTEGSTSQFRCTVCGATASRTDAPLGHAWSEWNTLIFPTCIDGGRQMRRCARCGLSEEQELAPRGHDVLSPQKSMTNKDVLEGFCRNCGQTVQIPRKKGFFEKHKKGFIATLASVTALAVLAGALWLFVLPEYHYNRALQEIENGDYAAAYHRLKAHKDYKDSADLLERFSVEYGKTLQYTETGGEWYLSRKEIKDRYGNTTFEASYSSDGNTYYHEECRYDENGYITHRVKYDEDGRVEEKSEYTNDENGNMLVSIDYDARGRITEKVTCIYNKNGDVTSRIVCDGDGNVDGKREWSYDEHGNVLSEVMYDEDGAIVRKYRYEYTYGEDGNILQINQHEDLQNETTKAVYDAEGKPLSSTTCDADGKIRRKSTYTYDENGNRTCFTYESTQTDGTLLHNEFRYEYDANGNLTLVSQCDENGELTGKTKYTYDKKGNRTHAASYDGDGKIQYKTQYQYDDSGNVIMEINDPIERNEYNQKTETTYEYDEQGFLVREKKHYIDEEDDEYTHHDYSIKTEYYDPIVLYTEDEE